MPGKIDARLGELNIKLPEPPAPVASYVPYVVSGNLVFISGQVTVADGTDAMAKRIERVLTNDPGIGVARHVDAGYDEAKSFAKQKDVKIPMAE